MSQVFRSFVELQNWDRESGARRDCTGGTFLYTVV